jgi:thiamine-phosphate diphosphorylase
MAMTQLPPLYPITDARLETPLSVQVRNLGQAGFPLVQFRGKPLDARTQWRELETALAQARADGGWPAICVNDRADLAVLAAWKGLVPWGLHLGQTDLPHRAARGLPGLGRVHLGGSAHRPEEWLALDPACDHAGVGPLRATATKTGHARPLGLEGLEAGCRALRAAGVAPAAIGGLTPEDARDAFRAGAEALAMVGAVARSGAPGELLWQVQAERWRARRPFAPGQGIVILGGSGAGKTTLAEHLARRLGLPARDSDQRVVERRGEAIPAIFAAHGEGGFRALEAQVVRECLLAPGVVALGAGAWEDPDTRAAVRASGFAVLWLAEVPRRAWARVGGDPGRPLAGTFEQFMSLWACRTKAWWEGAMVLPLGRSQKELADALLSGTA